MSYRVILLPLSGQGAERGAIEAALALAHRYEAEVVALFSRVDPGDIVPFIGEGVSPAVIEQLHDAAEEENGRRRQRARQALEETCGAAAVPIVESPDGGRRRVRWLQATGDRAELVMAYGRLSDLVIFSQPGADSDNERQVVEAALLGSGRPLLLIPPDGPSSLGHAVAVAWNGSLEAARAVAGAMPFLEAAGVTHVLTAETRKTGVDRAQELAHYLRQHDVVIERHLLEPRSDPVGAVLLERAVALGADLLVMGGYGRSRLRELMLGGVTRHILGHARMPILLAH